ncbi:MAG: hypothetical protein QM831_44915 [Kofleriaceae bacterium]
MRFIALLLVVGCDGGAMSAPDYCEAREKLFEKVNAPDDRRDLLVSGCTKMLSKPEAKAELTCRIACLHASQKLDGQQSLTDLNTCDATCF